MENYKVGGRAKENYPFPRPSVSQGSSLVPSLTFAHCLLPCLIPQDETLKTLSRKQELKENANGNIWLNGQGLISTQIIWSHTHNKLSHYKNSKIGLKS
ncbi:hypothetical protein CR513_11243, partial [Mucuna pruriens]